MKIVLSWLQEFFSETLTAKQVVDALYRVGIEVEHVEEMGQGLDGVIVAKIEEFKQHPNADKLSLCKVYTGTETLDIVCGAKNFKAGDHVALATVGAVLPGDFKIQKSKIRGEISNGMLCSAQELGFPDLSNGEGILILDLTTQPGQPLKEALKLGDAILHLGLTPNRGDCFSILGIAIEVAAALNFKMKPVSKSITTFNSISIPAEVADTQACSKYTLLKIEKITIKPSAPVIKQRLEKSGVRSINNIVDLTNYMMLERGQPMHAFDADKVKGKITVRRAMEGETLLCLDDQQQTLNAQDLVIADESGPIGIAGVMGGKNSAVTEETKNILLESALFDPQVIRTTSRRLNLISESSKRFEREIDPTTVLSTGMVTASMMEEHSGGKMLGGVDLDYLKLKNTKIQLKQETIERVLGINIPNGGEYLSRLGFSLEKMGDGWMVQVPARRPEIQREIDLVEEVARIHGYDNIPSTLPKVNVEPKLDSTFARVELLRQKIISLGLQEVRTYSFASKDVSSRFSGSTPIRVDNPLTPESSTMRTSLLPGLLECWKTNASRQGLGVRIFEIGKTFEKQKEDFKESLKLGVVLAGNIEPKLWFRQKDRFASYYDGKGFLDALITQYRIPKYQLVADNIPSFLHPGQSVQIVIARKTVGYMGMIHPSICRELKLDSPICVLEMDLAMLLEMANRKAKFIDYSSYPKVERDLAFVIKKDIRYQDVVTEIQTLNLPHLIDTYVFDRFEGGNIAKDSVSLAYRFVFQSSEKTLTDQEVELSLGKISKHLKAKFEVSLRS